MAEGISLNIDFETKEALEALRKIQAETQKSTKQMSSAFNAVKGAATAALAFVGSRELFNFFSNGVKGAREQETALQKLSVQLALTGEGGKEAAQSFFEFAEALEASTTIEAEAILGAAKLAKAYGLSNDQAKALTAAAIDLAATTGDSLEGAVSQLTNTYSGNIRQLGRLIPELRTLTKEQLANGDAIKIVAERYKGAAVDSILPFEKAIFDLNKAIDDTAESFGQAVISSEPLTEIIKVIADTVRFIQGITDSSRGAFSTIIDFVVNSTLTAVALVSKTIDQIIISVLQGFGLLAKGIGALLNGVSDLIRGFFRVTSEGVAKFVERFDKDLAKVIREAGRLSGDFLGAPAAGLGKLGEDIASSLNGAADSIQNVQNNFDGVRSRVKNAGKEVKELQRNFEDTGNAGRRGFAETAEEVSKLREEALKFTRDLETKGLPALEKLDAETQDNIRKLETFFKEGRISRDEFERGITGIASAYARERTKIVEEEATKQTEAVKKSFDEISKFTGPLIQGISQAGAVGGVDERLAENQKSIEENLANGQAELRASLQSGKITYAEYQNELSKLNAKAEKDRIKATQDAEKERQKIFQGAASGAVTGIAATAIDAFAPGLGQIAKPLLDLFAQGPEATKAAVKGFVEAIPTIIEAIAASAPVFVEALVDSLITKGGIIRIAAALLKALVSANVYVIIGQRIAQAFGLGLAPTFRAIQTALGGIADILGNALSNFGQGFINLITGALNFVRSLFTIGVQALVTAVKNLLDEILKIPQKILDGIAGAVKTIGDEIAAVFKEKLGFLTEEPGWVKSFREAITGQKAKSAFSDPDNPIRRGVVGILTGGASEVLRAAGVPGFANGGIVGPDTRLALTRPDEMMLNPRQQSNLFRQLNSGTIGSDDALPLLAKIATLLEGGTTVETSINIGPDKLATAILNLNRRNARLTT